MSNFRGFCDIESSFETAVIHTSSNNCKLAGFLYKFGNYHSGKNVGKHYRIKKNIFCGKSLLHTSFMDVDIVSGK